MASILAWSLATHSGGFSWCCSGSSWKSIEVYEVGVVSSFYLRAFSFEVSGLATFVAVSGWGRSLNGIEICVIIGIDPCLIPIHIVSVPVVPLNASSAVKVPSMPVVLPSAVTGPVLVDIHGYG
jgi:hypothetical protein